ncbi:DUF456 family protein [candidate division KSB1 bacterium]
MLLLGFMTVMSVAVDIIAAGFGAKRAGASRQAVFGGIAGAIIGIFFGLPGIIIGPFIGAVAGQYMSQSDWSKATNAGIGTWLGLVLGTAFKLAIAIAMLVVFITSYIF